MDSLVGPLLLGLLVRGGHHVDRPLGGCRIGGRDQDGAGGVVGEGLEEEPGALAQPGRDVLLIRDADMSLGECLIELVDEESAGIVGGQQLRERALERLLLVPLRPPA
jgi:hypothetical protein